MVDVDDCVAREEPMLAAAEEQKIAELRAAIFKLPEDYREPLAFMCSWVIRWQNLAMRAALERNGSTGFGRAATIST
jgi:hypothetical protein